MIIWGTAFPWQKSYDYKLNAVELRGEIKKVEERASELESLYKALSVSEKDLNKSDNEYNAKKSAITQRKRELYIELIEAQQPVDTGLEKFFVINEAQVTFERIGLASVAIGIFISAFGFWAWYFKIQRHIDRDLEKKMEGKP